MLDDFSAVSLTMHYDIRGPYISNFVFVGPPLSSTCSIYLQRATNFRELVHRLHCTKLTHCYIHEQRTGVVQSQPQRRIEMLYMKI